jgi:hypothetical protein
MAELCEDKKNMGVLGLCLALPKQFRRMLTLPKGATIPAATLADLALLEAYIADKLVAPLSERWFLWDQFDEVEDNSEQPIYLETSLSDKYVRAGKYRYRLSSEVAMSTHRARATHAGANQDVIFFDVENGMFFPKKSNGDGKGYSLSLFNPENLRISDGSNPTMSPCYLVLANAAQVNKTGYLLPNCNFIEDLLPLIDVDIALTADVQTVNDIYVTVKATHEGISVAGLALADFKAVAPDGVTPIVITARLYENGKYKLTTAGDWVDGAKINLVTPDLLTTSKRFESTGQTAAVVIP